MCWVEDLGGCCDAEEVVTWKMAPAQMRSSPHMLLPVYAPAHTRSCPHTLLPIYPTDGFPEEITEMNQRTLRQLSQDGIENSAATHSGYSSYLP